MAGEGRYHGVYPVVPTPLNPDESLDLNGLKHLVEYYISEGCHGLLVLGSGGESPYFSIDEKFSIVKAVTQKVKNRIPVIVGCTFLSLAEIVAFFKRVDRILFDAYLVALPAYYPLRFNDVFSFYSRITRSTRKQVMYYHFPQITGLFFKPDEMKKLYTISGIIGAKESSVCRAEMKRNIRNASGHNFSLFSGTSQLLLANLKSGGSGVMCSIPSVAPGAVVECYTSWMAGDYRNARRIEDAIYRHIGLMNSFKIPAAAQKIAFKAVTRLPFPTMIGRSSRQAVFKETLRQLGHPVRPTVRSPLPQITETDRKHISAMIEGSDILRRI
ncbi:MAG: dihydrodipicolinate synthase family protein [Spirochaetes bacterium]|nr:dihydrodipicolinate synthase family protein [Spirochaetota bacterium]